MRASGTVADFEPDSGIGISRVANSEPCASDGYADGAKQPAMLSTEPSNWAPLRTRTRFLSIEVLRMAAIFGIAVFHTFKPWFDAICEGKEWVSGTGLMPASHVPTYILATLGCIDQLGTWGNHVFIMISGYFLLPRAIKAAQVARGSKNAQVTRTQANASGQRKYWIEQYKVCISRAKIILITVALYAACALCVGMSAPKLTYACFDDTDWLLRGLQFIWVYLALVMLCPFIGWIWCRTKHPTLVLLTLVLAVYVVNLYIAFVSPGNQTHNLWQWRKFMSAITYGVSFVAGGWIGGRVRVGTCRHGTRALVLAIISILTIEIIVACSGSVATVDALSYKSTSPLAFALAIAALLCALSRPVGTSARYPGLTRVISNLVSGTLGFYVLESFYSRGWHRLAKDLLKVVARYGFIPFIAVGCLFSAGFLLLLLIIDSSIRRPFVRWIARQKS